MNKRRAKNHALNSVKALKPSLRAALHLVQEFGDLAAVLSDIQSGKVGTLAKIVLIASGRKNHARFLHGIATHGAKQIPALQPYFVAFIYGLIADVPALSDASDTPQIDTDEPDTDQPDQTPDRYYLRLFQIGTGVLGWTPAVTWNATPTEITLAYRARTEFVADILKSVFGTTDEKTSPTPVTKEALDTLISSGKHDPKLDRAALDDLRAAI
ncbi:phage tail assembly chaperone [Ochrobactrum sp. Q0168]|uniref:phage tail assembly chaperone n=1 Tax=Ochrobactrum sp. Q0168 TaxID=2793241 RepID=UPI0018EDE0C0|nr:phage tail assembly chaperone [Ochrobactrum sp. Q0168]